MVVKLSAFHFHKYLETLDPHEEVWYEICGEFTAELDEFNFDEERVEEAGEIFPMIEYSPYKLRDDTDEVYYMVDIPYDEYGMEFLRNWNEMLEEEAREGCLMRG